ncbi:hypothetical protein CWE12_07580 [Aliidiomarina sedimenti]|uniref:Fe-S metabolism associated domain-containing protein n=1 Tax=Aliidiomarina sedimenti TaxID=1933879 RepID=A0ABY0BYX4_9GAMM|nr:SufE family protein [Aliidiomarina sedimenti]RUO29824.1 hypothetical protein CWE12_07580 [Aliidiomarina sedimenti]
MTTLPAEADSLRQQLLAQGNWQETYRVLLLAAKTQASLDPDQRTPANRVHGCEAQVYLRVEGTQQHANYRFQSDARMVQALIYASLLPLQGQTAEAAMQFDASAWLTSCGLEKQLSPSRSNGLYQVIKAAKAAAQTLPPT